MGADQEQSTGASTNQFPTTKWSRVIYSIQQGGESRLQGWELLCADYWKPVYGFLRRSGLNHQDSEDLTQSFFHHLYSADWPAKADPGKGRFRNFLIKTLKFFLSNSNKKASAQKRGGHIVFSSLEALEGYLVQNPGDADQDPSTIFDKIYALNMIEKSNQILASEYVERGQSRLYQALSELGPKGRSYEDVADEFQMSVKAVEGRKTRLNTRRNEIFRELISQSVSSHDEIEEEILYLRRLLNH